MKVFTVADFQKWGAIGGRKSRRVLTPEQARAMVRAREAKRASMKKANPRTTAKCTT